MNEETNKKQQRLLEMTEHPERFTDEELESMLHDPDMQDTLRMLALTRRAADAHLHDTADVDQEWQRFAAAYHPRHHYAGIAAAIAGGVLIAGLAVAAVVKLNLLPSHQEHPKTVVTQTTGAIDSVRDSVRTATVARADTMATERKVYDDVSLSTILTDMGAYYHKTWKAEADAKTDVRLYFVWDRRKSLEENIELLNNFNRFDIAVEGNVIVVK